MTVRELREKYLRFFESKGHSRFPSGSLIPVDVTGRLDESLLFNGAGMVQFKPYFRGVAQPPNKRLITAQKCVRTGDIETVGDLTHLTFFEMMGNFSFGDYFKAQAIAFSWEFITSPEWLGLDPRRVCFTVFEEDDEAFDEWSLHLIKAGIEPAERVFRLGEDTNYWPAGAFSAGPPGPCGPNTEMFYWTSNDVPPPSGPYTAEEFVRDEAEGKWLEFWNDVFIQYEWQGHLKNPERPDEGFVKDGMPPLPFQSVDTGMGLERCITVLSGRKDLYECDSFTPILRKLEEVSRSMAVSAMGSTGVSPVDSRLGRDARGTHGRDGRATYGGDPEKDRSMRIIADHIRTAVFCIADGVLPGNNGRGYVLRRLIRRAVLKGQRVLGFEKPFFHLVYEGVAEAMADHYHELIERRDVIVETLKNEEALFRRTIEDGLQRLYTNLAAHVFEGMRNLPVGQFLIGGMNVIVTKPSGFEYTTPTGEGMGAQHTSSAFSEMGKVVADLVATLQPKPLHPTDPRQPWSPAMSGRLAHYLYDTHGFPLEVTQEIAAEAGFTVDVEEFKAAMLEAQERSRASAGMDTVYGNVAIQISFQVEGGFSPTPTHFLGYDTTSAESTITAVLPQTDERGQTTGLVVVALDQTPFYAESGGQISDEGVLLGDGFELRVVDLIKQDGVFVHLVEPAAGGTRSVASAGLSGLKGMPPQAALDLLMKELQGQKVQAVVNAPRRREIQRNHTATHLLQAALRSVLGKHVTQQGSYVGPDHLRFDFTHGKALSAEELARVEKIVNEQSLENTPVVTYADLPIAEAKKRGAMALFGEKYGDKVRMVEIGDFSRELCGGTHARSTGEIGLFKILSETSAASGVRRVEALTGEGAYQWALSEERRVKDASSLLKTNPGELTHAVAALQEALKEERRKREKAEAALIQGGPKNGSLLKEVKGIMVMATRYDGVDQKLVASNIDQEAAKHPNLAALAAIVADGRVQLVCKIGPEAMKKGLQAGKLVGEVARAVGGGGGGRPDFATAGGKDPSKVDEALRLFERLVEDAI